ncbi:MAG: class I SAM-dependent methyltransferase [Nitrososphaeria archaeon]
MWVWKKYIYRILEFFVQDVDVIGVDISRKMMRLALEIAKKKNLKSKVSYVVCDAENLPFRDTSFDLILCYDLLEHLPNPSLCIKEFGRTLLKDGHVIIYTLNRNYKYTFDWLLERIFYKWLQKRRIKVGHFPEKYLNINELNSMLSKNHMYSVKIIPMHCFVTGIWDIYILPLISNLKYRKKENGKRESAIKNANSFQRLIKFLIAYISYALKIFSLMDRPLEKRFLSAGFFIFSYKIDN